MNLTLPCLVFEDEKSAREASAKLLEMIVGKLHESRGFVSSSDIERIMNEEELTYSSQNPTANNVRVSYKLRDFGYGYSGAVIIDGLNDNKKAEVLALYNEFTRRYEIDKKIKTAKPKEK